MFDLHRILAENGVKGAKAEAIIAEVMENLPTKAAARPPKVEDGVTYIWCSRHCQYHPADIMVPNKSKQSGFANYCKPAQRRWEWMHKHSQLLASIAAKLYVANDADAASTVFQKSEFLKTEKNNQPHAYDDITTDMSVDDVVALNLKKFYDAKFIQLIPQDCHKMLGIK